MTDEFKEQMQAARALLPTPPGADRPRGRLRSIVFGLFLIALFVYFFRIFDEQTRADRARGGGSAESALPRNGR